MTRTTALGRGRPQAVLGWGAERQGRRLRLPHREQPLLAPPKVFRACGPGSLALGKAYKALPVRRPHSCL